MDLDFFKYTVESSRRAMRIATIAGVASGLVSLGIGAYSLTAEKPDYMPLPTPVEKIVFGEGERADEMRKSAQRTGPYVFLGQGVLMLGLSAVMGYKNRRMGNSLGTILDRIESGELVFVENENEEPQ